MNAKVIDRAQEQASLSSDLSRLINSLGDHGYNFQVSTKNSLHRLDHLDEASFLRVQDFVSTYFNLLQDANISPEKAVYNLDNEKALLSACARRLGVVFHSDVIDKITTEDVIEVYNHDLIQIYRSLSFFNLCSYSLTDLLTNEFYELYERSVQVNSHLIKAGEILQARPYSLEPVDLSDIPRHLMREKLSEQKISFFVEFKKMYPIYTISGAFYGYLIVLRGQKATREMEKIAFI